MVFRGHLLQYFMRHLIIGNGVAGTSGSLTIRKHDATADITILAAEPYPFYSRIRLIDYLAGSASESDLVIFKPHWYENNRITVHLASQATRIDPDAHTVVCADGITHFYDRLLVATGGTPSVPPVSGIPQDFVFTLRSLADAQRIKQFAQQCKSVLVMGGGLLGIETAHALAKTGKNVTVIEFFSRLLPRQMDQDGAIVLQMALERLGLSFVLDAKAEAVVSAPGRRGIALRDGRFIAGDMIVISAGITPQTALFDNLPISKNRGILVNEQMETGIPDIYAAGDLVEHRNVVYGIWAAAEKQGKVAGANMAGSHERYEGTLPSNILKVAGIDLLSAGDIDADKKLRSVVEVDHERGIYRKLVLEGDTLVGCILCGSTEGKKEILSAIQGKQPAPGNQRTTSSGNADAS